MEPALSLHRYLQSNPEIFGALKAYQATSTDSRVVEAAKEIQANLEPLYQRLQEHEQALTQPDNPEEATDKAAWAVYMLYVEFFFPLVKALEAFQETDTKSQHVQALLALPALPDSAWRGWLDYRALASFGEALQVHDRPGERVYIRYHASWEKQGELTVEVRVHKEDAMKPFELTMALPPRGTTLGDGVSAAVDVFKALRTAAGEALLDDRNWPCRAEVTRARQKLVKKDSERILRQLSKFDLVRLQELLTQSPDIVRKTAEALL